MPHMLWQPSTQQIANANITAFRLQVESQYHVELPDYDALYQWSIEEPQAFWQNVWDFCGIVAEARGGTVLADGDRMPGAKWFTGARLNFAENLLQKRGTDPAIIFRAEDKVERTITWDSLHHQVSCIAQYLRSEGIVAGDRVVGFMPNMPETVVVMLAAASIGAVWSSCSPDFGVRGVVDRFGQIEPKLLVTATGYFYNGKFHDSLGKVDEFLQELPSVTRVIVVPIQNPDDEINCTLSNAVSYASALKSAPDTELKFAQLPFDHPLYVMYSSGTTGVPKCIVHSAGGTLIQHLKEMQLHCDLRTSDRLFYFTTCGWMMWNWLVSGLATGATIMLYDGSPFYPSGNVIFDFAQDHSITILGTSAKFIDAIGKAGIDPINTHDLSSVKTIMSTGSTLSPEGFEYVYQHIKNDVCLSSVSGGTDIMGCFVGGNPALPVYKGELQCRLLGMSVEVFNDDGQSVIGQKGELVCTAPFPSMPVGFWNDPDGKRYHNAYFARFKDIWCHGDFVAITKTGGMVIYGRSDTVLNPGGVRIGTAEIYRQVEQLNEVQESLVIGQDWNSDVRVILFVKLSSGVTLDDSLKNKIKTQVRTHCTPRHVPSKIFAVEDIPRTKSGKIVELAVRAVVHGLPVKNKEALANPEALSYFDNIAGLQEE